MMNILVLSSHYPSIAHKDNNVTKVVHYFCKEWVKLNHEVLVINNRSDHFTKNVIKKYEAYEKIDGVNIINNKIIKMIPKRNDLMFFQKEIYYRRIIRNLRNLNFKPDVLIVHFPVSQLDILKKLVPELGIPTYFTYHNTDVDYLIKNNVTDHLGFLQKNKVKVGFRSSMIREKFEKYYNYFDPNENIILSGINNPLPNINIERRMKTPVKLIFVGKLIKQKNLDFVLNVLFKMKKRNVFNFTLDIIGEGNEEQSLKDSIKKYGLENEVNFLGYMERNKIFEYLIEADIFIMISSPETFGLVYLEAMSSACITIGSKGEGIDGVIKHDENGFLVTPGDEESLQNILTKIINLPERDVIKYREMSYKTALTFSEEAVAKNYLEKVNHDKPI